MSVICVQVVDVSGVDDRVSYFSKRFNILSENYSTIEKDCLSLIIAIQFFEVYLSSLASSIVNFSDHNLLTFLHKMKIAQMETFIARIY